MSRQIKQSASVPYWLLKYCELHPACMPCESPRERETVQHFPNSFDHLALCQGDSCCVTKIHFENATWR